MCRLAEQPPAGLYTPLSTDNGICLASQVIIGALSNMWGAVTPRHGIFIRLQGIEAFWLITKVRKCYISLHRPLFTRSLTQPYVGSEFPVLCYSRKRMASKLRDTFGLPIFCLLLFWLLNLKLVVGILRNEPQQTSTISVPYDRYAQIPRPTAVPPASHDLLVRQDLPLFPTVCGYVSGDFCKLPSTFPKSHLTSQSQSSSMRNRVLRLQGLSQRSRLLQLLLRIHICHNTRLVLFRNNVL